MSYTALREIKVGDRVFPAGSRIEDEEITDGDLLVRVGHLSYTVEDEVLKARVLRIERTLASLGIDLIEEVSDDDGEGIITLDDEVIEPVTPVVDEGDESDDDSEEDDDPLDDTTDSDGTPRRRKKKVTAHD